MQKITQMARMAVLFGCLITLSVVLGLPGARATSAQASPAYNDWRQVPGVPANVDFRSVFMANYLSGIAVGHRGDHGVAYRLDGSQDLIKATPVDFLFRAPLSAVVMFTDTWAVGDQGLIVREHNGIWSEFDDPVPNATLLTIQMFGQGEEGWAGGYTSRADGQTDPVLLHYTDGRWQRDDSITGEGTINSIHFTQGVGWAVGNAGIWLYSKGAWTKEQEPDPCPEAHCFSTYNSVRAVSSDEAWIAGDRIGLCGICVPSPYLLHRINGKWQIAVDGNVQGDPTREGAGRELYGLTFTGPDAGNPNAPLLGWAVGTARDSDPLKPYILVHESTQDPSDWQYAGYPAGANGQLTSVSVDGREHAVAVGTGGTILSFGYKQQVAPVPSVTSVSSPTVPPATPGGNNPTQRVADPHSPDVTYFEQVGHTLRGGFRSYWQAHGGLSQFGYPLTEEFTETSATDGKAYTTQYFERARFEYHPENSAPYDVLLGLLGRTVTAGRENEAPFKHAVPQMGPGTLYFDATGHNIQAQFASYWQQHGGLPVYGYPISEAFTETSPTDGKPYLVQYFERNRLEYHPELPEADRVSLGLLGVQVLQRKGWIPVQLPVN